MHSSGDSEILNGEQLTRWPLLQLRWNDQPARARICWCSGPVQKAKDNSSNNQKDCVLSLLKDGLIISGFVALEVPQIGVALRNSAI